MKEVSATEAARRFSEMLDAVEHDGETFVVLRHGKAVARIGPTTAATGRSVKRLLHRQRPDRGWKDDLRRLRASLEREDRDWPA